MADLESSEHPLFGTELKQYAKSLQKQHERDVVPKQKEALARITVGTLEEKVGEDLARGIESTNNRDELIGTRVDAILRQIPEGTSVYKVSTVEEGHQVDILIRKSEVVEGTLQRIEVFRNPQNINGRPDVLRYKNHLLVDMNTGKVADLMDLLPENYISSWSGDIYPWSRYSDDKTFNLLGEIITTEKQGFLPDGRASTYKASLPKKNYQNLKTVSPFIKAHEMGHGCQNSVVSDKYMEDLKTLSEKSKLQRFIMQVGAMSNLFLEYFNIATDPKETIYGALQERNASAFALAAIRKYRELGVDLLPSVRNTELIAYVNDSLKTRPEHPQSPVKYSKLKR